MPPAASDPTKRFSSRVAYYVRARPHYPPALLQFLVESCHLSAADAVADIGSGTGFLSELFVANGNLTFAVEPNADMRAAAEAVLGQHPTFRSIDGTAEATTLQAASVRWVVAAQAVHWFDLPAAASEFRRILAPGGMVAVVWNHRLPDSPVAQAYQQLIDRYKVEPGAAAAKPLLADNGKALLPLFGQRGMQTARFDNPQPLDRAGLIDRIVSSSTMPLPGAPTYPQMLAAAEALFDQHQEHGSMTIPQETLVFYGSPRD